MSEKGTRPTQAYIGRKECGCIVLVKSNDNDEDTFLTCADAIKRGLTIELIEWAEYRRLANEDNFMKCNHGQLSLFTIVDEALLERQ